MSNIYDKRLQNSKNPSGLSIPTLTATRSATDFEVMQQEHIEQLKTWLADKDRQLAEARAEIERLALELENKQYTITCASEENQQLKESLTEARAEIENLKWHRNNEKAKAEAALALNDRALELVNEARADADHWKSECNALQRMVHESRAEIESKNRLVEQMRGALTKLIGTLEVMSVMPETLGKCPVLAIDAPELEQARAALAAERGE